MELPQKICILGLGYVGLPLAVEFSKKYPVIGIDSDNKRVSKLRDGIDTNDDIDIEELITSLDSIEFSNDINDAKGSNIYIVTVPTPIDQSNKPDLSILKEATKALSGVIEKSNLIIYESTVYPGATEDLCGAYLEELTGWKINEDFFLGYSPERINPGDKINTLKRIKKITSGSCDETATKVDSLYKSIIEAGTFKASSIKVAEAAKCLENTQRDINIALMNELSQMCDVMDIDTNSVIEAASTKWNFNNYKPGLVGGHCIGVDPYYLAHQSEIKGYYPDLIHTARNINNNIPNFIAQKYINNCHKKGLDLSKSNVLILGYTFKEDCRDFRNTKVKDLIHEIISQGGNVSLFDPYINTEDIKDKEIRKTIIDSPFNNPKTNKYDCIIVAVAHKYFVENQSKINDLKTSESFLIDVKGALDSSDWRL